MRNSRGRLLTNFISSGILLENRIRSLFKQFNSSESLEEQQKLYEQIKILKAFSNSLHTQLTAMIKRNNSTPDEIVTLFSGFVAEANEASLLLRENRSALEIIADTIKNMANFFIKMLTIGWEPQFFNTTTKPVDEMQRAAKAIESAAQRTIQSQVEQREDEGYRPEGLAYNS